MGAFGGEEKLLTSAANANAGKTSGVRQGHAILLWFMYRPWVEGHHGCVSIVYPAQSARLGCRRCRSLLWPGPRLHML